MKTKEEIQTFLDKTCRLITALQEVPFMMRQGHVKVGRFKFKPVLYVRPEVMNDILVLAPGWLTFTPFTETEVSHGPVTQHVPMLCGTELFVTNRPDAPEASIALEPEA